MNAAQTLRQVIDRSAEERSFGSFLVASDGDSEIRWILEHSGARLCFAPVDEGRRIRRAAPGEAPAVVAAEPDRALGWKENGGSLAEVGPDAPAVLDYTSGSTGRP